MKFGMIALQGREGFKELTAPPTLNRWSFRGLGFTMRDR